MAWWMYKCRAKGNQNALSGDWAYVFPSDGGALEDMEWGTTDDVPELKKLKVEGDLVLAYQTDHNELVGVACVRRWRGNDLWLRPVLRIGVKVRPLKKADPQIAKIPALQQGPRHTIYDVSDTDARRLLRAAGVPNSAVRAFRNVVRDEPSGGRNAGAGFGSPEQNKKVERAAVDFVTRSLERQGWVVTDVGTENCGYDLECTKGSGVRHVEVKGATGSAVGFILTKNEKRMWETDRRFELALVTEALAKKPRLSVFKGRKSMAGFTFSPPSYIVTLVSRP